MRQRKATGYEICSNCFVYPWAGEPIFTSGLRTICSDCEAAFDGTRSRAGLATVDIRKPADALQYDEDNECMGSDPRPLSQQ